MSARLSVCLSVCLLAHLVNHIQAADFVLESTGLMNRFRTGQGLRRADLHKCRLAQSPSCDCGQRQTINHIDDTCPLTTFEGGLNLLHEVDDDAVMGAYGRNLQRLQHSRNKQIAITM